jgi:hypothetical protein
MLGRITREAEKLTINGSGIQGIQSLSASYSSAAQPTTALGIGGAIDYYPQGPQQANLEVGTILTQLLPPNAGYSRDLMQNFTGTFPFSGVVDYGAKQFYFTEGYLETYSVKCGIGQIPETSTNSVIYGNFGTGAKFDSWEQTSSTSPSLNITSYGSMEINLDTFSTNRVSSFDVNIATPRVPLYALGIDQPTGVIAGTPIEVNVNFELEVDDYEIKSMRLSPDETVFKNTVITLKKNDSHDILLRYDFDNMLLTSESFNGGVDSNVKMNFNLRSFILREK